MRKTVFKAIFYEKAFRKQVAIADVFS